MALFFACATPVASAGDTYVLDRVRAPTAPTAEPGIVRIDSAGGQTRLNLFAAGPGVELPLREPVGIDVNEATGTLLVVDAGGGSAYPGTITYPPFPELYECNANSCGALLSIDPATGATKLVAGPGLPGQNLIENPYGVLARPNRGDALVADQGSTRIVRVDLLTGAQSVFNQYPGWPDNYPGGLRAPWGITEDPNGDVLVGNSGVPPTTAGCTEAKHFCALYPPEFGIPVPPDCLGNDGFVLRYSSEGVQKQLYCDAAFRRPRNVLVNGDGTVFAVDPFTQFALNPSETPQAVVGFGGIFQIEPVSGAAQLLTAGGSMATPSGIDFNSAGTSLLVADETLFPFAGPCIAGCGGVIEVNSDGGAQAIRSARGAQGETFVDPIALAVDRDGQAAPTLPLRSVPFFFRNITRPEGEPTTTADAVTALPFFPVKGGSRIVILCVDGGCVKRIHRKARGKKKRRVRIVPRVLESVTVPEGTKKEVVYFHGEPPRIRLGPVCKKGMVKKHGKCVKRKSRGRRHRHRGRKGERGANAPASAGKFSANVYVAIVAKPGFLGRYQSFTVAADATGHAAVQLLPDSGCLIPEAERVRTAEPRKTVTDCPPG